MESVLGIIEMVEDFLETRVLSKDGNFAPVSDDDVDCLINIFHEIVGTKWERDTDGDWPIDVIVIDRTKYEYMHYRPVAYRHLDKEQYRKNIVTNLQTAVRETQLSFDLDDIDRRFKERNA